MIYDGYRSRSALRWEAATKLKGAVRLGLVGRHAPSELCFVEDSIHPMTLGVSSKSLVASAVSASAPGKINLTLDVRNQRPDGFHELRSLVIGVDLRDRVRCIANPKSRITVACGDPSLNSRDNLVVTAATNLAQESGHSGGVTIELEKRIPVASGLGGGSSDAAATLRLCNELWGASLSRAQLATLGAQIGSDVPLFFSLPSALISGRGEEVEAVTLHWSGWVLLVFANCRVSTREVYRAWRPSDGSELPAGEEVGLLEAGSADELSALLRNHLEPAVFRVSSDVARAHQALNRLGFPSIRVSGAGSALYLLFDEQQAAMEAAERVKRQGNGLTTMVVAAPAGESTILYEEP